MTALCAQVLDGSAQCTQCCCRMMYTSAGRAACRCPGNLSTLGQSFIHGVAQQVDLHAGLVDLIQLHAGAGTARPSAGRALVHFVRDAQTGERHLRFHDSRHAFLLLPLRSGRAVTVASWFSSAIRFPCPICTSLARITGGLGLESVFFSSVSVSFRAISRARTARWAALVFFVFLMCGAAHPSGRRPRSGRSGIRSWAAAGVFQLLLALLDHRHASSRRFSRHAQPQRAFRRHPEQPSTQLLNHPAGHTLSRRLSSLT